MKKINLDLIRKQRLNYTITTTVIAAVFLLIVLGGLFGVVYASNDVFIRTSLDKALENPEKHNDDVVNDLKCVYVYKGNDGKEERSGNLDIYSPEDVEKIINVAVQTKQGKFRVNNRYFVVASKQLDSGTLYAFIDRTSYHTQLANTAIMVTLLYCISVVFVALLALLSSARLLNPVASAMSKQRDLIANASHELKTPLTIIGTNLSVIKSEPQSTVADNEKWIESITTQLIRMKDLVNSMLELSKLEQSELPKCPVDFSEIAEGACLSFEATCFEKNVKLLSDFQSNIEVYGEAKSLERLVIILLDNAIKYCGQNGKVGAKLTADGKNAHLSVMNTGESISKEEAEHVFDRFYRSDGARKNEDNQSFGLGLSIAAATVKAHDGTIECHGIEGKGTVFDVYIPLLKKKKDGTPIVPKKRKKLFEL